MKQKRTFSFSDVKSLIARHNEIENKLEELKLTAQKYNDKIKKTTEHRFPFFRYRGHVECSFPGAAGRFETLEEN